MIGDGEEGWEDSSSAVGMCFFFVVVGEMSKWLRVGKKVVFLLLYGIVLIYNMMHIIENIMC